jgi:hypothetical protein
VHLNVQTLFLVNMNTLIEKKDYVNILKEQIKESGTFYRLSTIRNNHIDDNCISVVMTASNRSIQTYFTLKKIAESSFKNVQVILVDDSKWDPCLITELSKLPLYITFIEIIPTNKTWINPVVNYNIGFKYIKGNKIIIQNAEIAHLGDVLADVNERVKQNDNSYYVYDVISVRDMESNFKLYAEEYNYENIAQLDIYDCWYQSIDNNKNRHFLTALSIDTFKKINCEFSYDYAFGFSYDDDDFLLKIVAANINIVNIHVGQKEPIGIHQYHECSMTKWGINTELNQVIFEFKTVYYDKYKKYIDLTINMDEFESKLDLLEEFNNLA